jgi:O-methyltransferase involved in polyketide biosynthesis
VIKEFLIRIADRFPGSEIAFDATSNIQFSNKMVLKRGNFNALLVWGLKNPAVMESWDSRISLQEIIPMFRPVRHKLGLGARIVAALSDRLKLQYVLRVTCASS